MSLFFSPISHAWKRGQLFSPADTGRTWLSGVEEPAVHTRKPLPCPAVAICHSRWSLAQQYINTQIKIFLHRQPPGFGQVSC